MRKIFLSLVVCCLSIVAFGQVTAISPTVDGSFENATSTHAANGWSVVNGVGRGWVVGTTAGASHGTKSSYIGTAAIYGSNANTSMHHFYRDVTIPAGATNVLLNFALRYTNTDPSWDFFYVYTTATSSTPVAGSLPTGTQRFVNTNTLYSAFTDMATINLTALAGTTFRLVFTFRNDGVTPHAAAAVDKVSLVYTPCSAPGISGGTLPICAGSSAVLTSGTGGGAWISSNGAVASITTSGSTCTVNGLTAGTSNISYTVAGCPSIQTVTVNSMPAAYTISPATSGICAGTAQALTAPAITPVSSTGSTVVSSTGAFGIPDNTPAGTTNGIAASLPAGATITSMSVTANVSMSASAWIGDVVLNLVAPNGSILNLFNGHGGSGSGMVGTVISSNGVTSLASSSAPFTGTFAATAASGVGPTSFLSNTTAWTSLYSVPSGTWMLAGRDQASGDVPTVTSWSITFNYTYPLAGTRTWAPLTGLYTDAGMTTAYTGTSTNTVYASPASATTYTASASYPGFAPCARTATSTVTINATVPTPITGTLQRCASGPTSTLGNATGSGAWASSSPGVASISAGGVVTPGATAGTARISYTVSGMCPATAIFTVNGVPGSITGTTSICMGANTTLSNSGGIGTWTSTNGAVGTVGASTGIVSGLTAGTTAISYSNGCGSPVGTVVTVLQTGSITGGNPSCVGTGTTLSGATAGTWASSNGAVATINSGGVVNPLTAGTTVISFTPTNGCGAVGRVQTVNASPTVPAIVPGTSSSICLGSASSFTATSTYSAAALSENFNSGVGSWTVDNTGTTATPATVQWQGKANGFFKSSTSETFTTPDATGFIMVDADLGGSGTTTHSLVMSPVFSIPSGFTSATLTYQHYYRFYQLPDDHFARVEISTNGGGSWSTLIDHLGATVGSSAAFATQTINVTPYIGQSNLRLRFNYESVWGYFWALNNVSVTASAAPSYSWAGISGATGLSCTSCQATTITPTATGANVYSVTASFNGCSSNNGVTVTTTDPQVFTVGGAAAYCAGGSGVALTLSGSQTGVNYALKNGATTVDTKPGTGSGITFAAQTTGATYSVVATSTSPVCTKDMSGTATITVNALPTAVTVTPVAAGCGTVTVTASNGGSGTIYYQGTSSGGTSTAIASAIANVTTVGTTTHYFRAQSSAGCWGTEGSTPVTVNALPTTTTVTASPSAVNCYSTTLTANNGSSGTMYYQGTNPTGTSTATAANTVNVTTSGTYYFRAQSGAGCWGNPGSLTVTINTCVDVTNFATAASNVCRNTSTTVTVNSTTLVAGTYTVTYSISGANTVTGATAPITMSGGSATFTIPAGSLASAGSNTVTVTAVSDFSGFSASPSSPGNAAAFTVFALPATVTASGAGTFCGSTSISGANGSDGTIFYQGLTSNGTNTGLGGSPQTVASSGTYYFRARSSDGCWGNQGSVAVTITTIPTAAPTNNGPICVGGTVTFNANPATGASTYSWTGPNSFTSTAQNPTATPTVTGVYSLTVTDGTGNPGCSPATVYTTEVTVRPKPIASPSNNGYICAGGAAQLTASPSGGATVFAWSGTPISSATAENPTASPTTTTTYSLTVSDGSGDDGCAPADIYTTTVMVSPKPTAAPTNNGYICNGGTAILTANPANGANTYAWTGASILSTTAENPTANPTATSVYSLTVSDGSGQPGCTPTDVYTTQVTVNAKPVATPVNDGPICAGGTVQLTAAPAGGATTYNWTGTPISSASAENPTATPTTNTTYSLTVSDGSTQPGCAPSDIYTTTVVVKAKPVAAPSNNGYICNGGTANLTANPGGGATVFAWSGTPISSATAENPTANPTATTTYSLTVSDGSGDDGCAPSDVYTTTVTVNDKPIAAPTNNGYICVGGTVTLTSHPAGGADTYVWSGTALSSSSAENPTAVPTATTIYSLTVSDGSTQPGCAPADVYTTEVTVNAKPVATPVNDGPICAGGTVQLTAAPAGGATTYNWAGTSVSSTSAENPTATPTTNTTYSLTVSDGSSQPGCAPSDIYTTTVVVKAKPVATPSNNGYICNGGTANLTANPSGGATVFAWSGTPISSATAENPTANPTATTTYSLTVSDGSGDDGCAPSDVYTTTVVVNDKPIAAPVNSGILCNGGTVTLNAMPAGGANTFNWSGSSLLSASAQNPTATPSTGTHVYSLTVSDGTTQPGCAPADVYTTEVTVNPAPALTGVTNDGPVCEGITLNFSANGATNVTNYSWAGPVAMTGATTATPSIPGSTIAATGTYTVTVSNGTGSGCDIKYTNAAIVHLVPSVASITPSTTNICIGTAITFTAGTATGAGALTSYNWSGPNGFVTTTGSGSTSFTTSTTAQSGIYTLTVTYPGTGCTSPQVVTPVVTVNVLPTMVSMGASPSVLCAGATLTLTGNGAFGVGSLLSYNWTGPNSYASTSSSAAQLYVTPDAAASGAYSVTVTYTGTGCTSMPVASGVVTVNPLPTIYDITGGGFYCSGGTGVFIGLSDSDPGINYQLYYGSTADLAPMAGTGNSLEWSPARTAAGTYSIVATDNVTSCTIPMNGTTNVSVGPVPIVYSMTGGGGYCAGGAGSPVGLSNGDVGVGYQLYRDGITVGGIVSPTVAGPFSFGTFTATGSYTAVANPSAVCSKPMAGSANVSINPLPNIYNVGGGGSYCAGGAGLHITQDFSVVGINYQLYNGSSIVGTPVAGASSGLDFGVYTATGTYSVRATNTTTGCINGMNGMPVININPLPTVFNISGGGSYCAGGSGHTVSINGTTSGINYQVYNGSTAVGTPVSGDGSAMTLGTFTAAGTYTVRATNPSTGCTNGMSGNAVISINALPTAYAMTGGGVYCSGGTGVHVGLAHSDLGMSYALYNGGTLDTTMPGANSGLDFGFMTDAGTYTVLATNIATGCVNTMSGSATVNVNPIPQLHTVTGGGTTCENGGGLTLGLNGSNAGMSYQLYNGASAVGSPVNGNTLAISFGPYNTSGTYTVLATHTGNGCTRAMSGNAVINVNPAPTAQTVTGGGGYCAGSAGSAIGLATSQMNVQYQLYNGSGIASGVFPGDGNPINFGTYTATGTYSVLATNIATFCTNAMANSVTISVNPLPSAFNVTGGGTYCAGGTGVNIGISNSVVGINYQLYRGSSTDGAAVSGTGSSINFGLKMTAGTYSVQAINPATGCTNGMNGTVNVAISPAPPVHTVTGGGNYCTGTTGSVIGLNGSNVGINYRLYMGVTPMGGIVAGTGGAISMSPQTTVGTYSIIATDAGSSCTSTMSGNATIGVNSSPTAFSVTGNGHYCAGGTGVVVGQIGSTTGVNYQLYRGSTAVGTPVAGTGMAISFGAQTVAGTYTVLATDGGNSCTSAMTGSAVVVVDPLPTAQTVSGGGQYCAGGAGVHISLLFANSGINYQLYNGATAVGSPVPGANANLDFGFVTAGGTYTVLGTDAVTGCTNTMSGSATIVVNPLPTVQTVTGGGSFCSDASGVAVNLSGSQTGVNYQLYVNGTATGMPIGGTGASFSFGSQTVAGTYSVHATNVTTACVRNMSGSVNVVSNPAPTVYTVTGGGTLCTGQAGYHIGLSGSQVNVVYNLYNGATSTGITMNGTGSAIDFGTFTTAGIYTVTAMHTGTGCTNNMAAGAVIVVNPLPTIQNVTGGGQFCTAGTGVPVGLAGTQTGINYTLYRGSVNTGTTIAGTGSSITFGMQTISGTYSVLATNASTTCTRGMNGTAGVTVNALPAVQSVTGGGSFCAGGTGVNIGLNSSQSGVSYQLYSGSTTYGSAASGTGSAISFGAVDVAGTYTVRATNFTTACVNNMSGSANVVVNALPTAYTVSGGGSYCTGATGVTITLSGSQTGVSYQLYNGSTLSGSTMSGTGSALSFGGVTPAGTYSILATNTSTGCTKGMSSTTNVTVLPLPTVHNVTGGGTYCAGGAGVNIGLSSSNTGVNYQLYNGATAVGTAFTGSGLTFDFGLQAALGTYTVLATNIFTGCSVAMNGSTTISTNPLPNTQTVTGGGTYCAGGPGMTVGLASSEAGISYQLYRGATITGTPVSGTNSSISFGLQTTAGAYTVLATNTSTGCTKAMSGSATIIVNAVPVALNVTGGGSYCAGGTGVAIGLNNSVAGTTYQLYYGNIATGSPVAGIGTAISFGNLTSVGSYSVRATITATGCTNGMTNTATVTTNALPTLFSVTGGGSYCVGGAGVPVGLSGSTNGVNYQLYRGAAFVGTAPGTGSAISFGMQATAGNYSVVATNASTSCTRNMTGSAIISINALPVVQSVSGGGSYCAGGSGVAVGLTSTEGGVSYQLYRNGATVGSPVAGTGTSLNFGVMTIAGTYSVSAANATTACANNMAGTAVVSINALPEINTITGGGSYCTGGAGVAIGLGGSQIGVAYQLYNGTAASGVAVNGTGNAISFGMKTAAGTYSVMATNLSTTCTSAMSGTTSISINPLPNTFSVSGGGSFCAGGTGVNISLSGSGSSISYQLYNGATAVGAPVTGTGGTVSFGLQTAAGTYTVMATNSGTGCTKAMTGSAMVTINTPPTVFAVTGGGAYCAGGVGQAIGLSASTAGVNYQLYFGSGASGSPVAGTGGALSFGLKTSVGTYTVSAVNATTGCSANMSGSATISVNALPLVQTVTGGGAYCAGGNGVFINMTGSENGVDYQLYNGGAATGVAMHGTGGGMSFGLQTAAGTYTVMATNVGTGCTKAMNSSATVAVNTLPTVFNMTGGGSYCSGGNGVAVGLSGSTAGISYKLYNGTTFIANVAGTGTALNFGMKTAGGNYNVVATSTSGCMQAMAGVATVVVNATPVAYSMTGGGNYCIGGTGVNVGLGGSSIGVNYQLYNGSSISGGIVAGTGNAIDFGLKTVAGTYSVMAVDPATSCSRSMTGTVSVGINALPTAQAVTGGGSYCAGGAGVTVALSGSQTGVNYQLYNGTETSGTAVTGTGAGVSFGTRTAAGIYTVKATNAMTGCISDMTGSATVIVNELPAAHTMTGGGDICIGAAGVNVGLSSSNTGVNYRLYNGTAAVGGTIAGTGDALSFGTFTTAGTYTVQATNSTTGCTTAMSGVATVVVNPLPTVYNMTGGGNFCAGGNGVFVGITGSQPGVNYNLYNGSTLVSTTAGTGGTLNFGRQTEAGAYTVIAMNATTNCVRNMSGSSTVTITALPVAFDVTGGGAYCAGSGGVSIGLEGSQAGVNYQLYEGVNASGAAVAGNGLAISFGPRTTDGMYTVKATNATHGCVNMMTGNASVLTNSLPATYTVTGGGNYCAGGEGKVIGLEGSAMNVNYTLYNGTTAVAGPVAGTDNMISFGLQTMAGTYTVQAADATTGCNSMMAGTAQIAIDALPIAQTVTASATSYCSGGAGINVSLMGSGSGITYTLYNGAAQVGSVAGTGVAVSFGNMTATGTYTAKAVNNTTGCMSNMTGSTSISINPLPFTFPVTGGGAVCAGSTGAAVGLAGSQAGINYILKMGSATIGAPVAGTGDAISFGPKTNAGTYTVMAMNVATGCGRMMGGNAVINVNALPTAYTVTGGGSYCNGGAGVHVGISNSQSDVSYQLYKDGTATGFPMAGTGSAVDFGSLTEAGTYSVMATNTMTSCTRAMTGSTTISVNALPEAVNVTGGGSFCAGGTGVAVGISGSANGTSYRLYRGSTPVATASGTGSGMSFGTYSVAGVYTVSAVNTTTGCAANMNGMATVAINALPTVQNVTGGGSYCAGGIGVNVGLSNSQNGVQYQLYMGATAIGGTVSGNGSSIGFGEQVAAGNYTVMATNASSCSRAMSGTATVSITPVVTPVVTLGMSTENTVCAGTEVTYTATAVNGGTAPTYNWMVNGAPAGVGAAAYTYTPANGDVVSVLLTSNAACAAPATSSAAVNMIVNPMQTPTVDISADHSGTICRGTSVTFTATSEFGGTAPVYSWMRNGVLQTTGAMYTVAPNDGDVVSCMLTSNYACKTTSTANSNELASDVVDPLNPVVQITADATIIHEGQPVTFTAILSDAGVSPDVQWLINGDEVPGASTLSFVTSLLKDKDTVSVHVIASGPCGDKEVFATVVVDMSAVGVAGVDMTPMDVRIMPNPNNGTFVIKGSLGSSVNEEVHAEVTNMLGQVVYRDNIKAVRGNIDHRVTLDGSLANGVYLLNITAGAKSQVFYVTVGK